ncbi:MAG: UbiD family decarboxylase [Chitinispirillaceae bacterium]|nr:UbiD family decarboxylase [Chitinispirillaceae bacterium]
MNLRECISKLRNEGLLVEIDHEVDWKYEIGTICRENIDTPILFTKIKDYKDSTLFTGGFSSVKTIRTVLEMDKEQSLKQIGDCIRERLRKKETPCLIDKTYNRNGFSSTTSVNLFELPVPWWDKRDCGRYIGTWHANITKDIVSKIRNVGIYRMMIIDDNHTTISVSANSHLAQQFLVAEKKGLDLEMVTAIGTQEDVVLAASTATLCGIDELEIAGSILRKPVSLGLCETIDLEYPIDSEIILEGRLKAGVRVTDGPFADYTGVANSNRNALLYEVTAMHCRENCIFRGMAVGKPGAEDHKLLSVLASIGMMNFHGSKLKNRIQTLLLRNQLFTLFQLSGRNLKVR